MILREMIISNYRNFKDTKLQIPQPTEEEFITIVIGSMGSGKTVFTDAYKWCLYGDSIELGNGILSRFDEVNPPITTSVKTKFDAGERGIISLERTTDFVSVEGELKQVCSDGICSRARMSTVFKEKRIPFDDPEKFIEWYFPKSVLPLQIFDCERLTDDRFLSKKIASSDTILEIVSRVTKKLESVQEIFGALDEYLSLKKYTELARKSAALSQHLEKPLDKQRSGMIELGKEERYILETFPKDIDHISPSVMSMGEYSAVVMLKILQSLSTIDLTNPIIMDSPFANFDPTITKKLGEIMKTRLKGKQVIILMTDSEYGKIMDTFQDCIQVEYEIDYDSKHGASFKLRN